MDLNSLKLTNAVLWTLEIGQLLVVPERNGRLHAYVSADSLADHIRGGDDINSKLLKRKLDDALNTIARDAAFGERDT